MYRIYILFSFILISLASCNKYAKDQFVSDSKGLKRKLKYSKYIENLYINSYSDSIFPNKDLASFSNLKKLQVYSKGSRKEAEPKPVTKIDTANFACLKNLDSLEMAFFNFNGFPKDICTLSNLKVLRIDLSLINSIPPDIYMLKNLKELRLRLNHIKDVPTSIKLMKSLKVLDLANNPFKGIPETLSDIDSIEVINISDPEGFRDPILSFPRFMPKNTDIDYGFFDEKSKMFPNIDILNILLKKNSLKLICITVKDEVEGQFVLKNIDKNSDLNKLYITKRTYY